MRGTDGTDGTGGTTDGQGTCLLSAFHEDASFPIPLDEPMSKPAG